MQVHFASMAAIAFATALYAAYADRRRHRRSDPDRVGFMPWTAITVFGFLAAIVALALALRP